MSDFGFEEMQQAQRSLHAKYEEKWGPLSPRVGRDHLLWMMAEAGEVADVVKKRGDEEIMDDAATRSHFVEELCDVLMYFNDVMLCYSVTPEEIGEAYRKKFRTNLERW